MIIKELKQILDYIITIRESNDKQEFYIRDMYFFDKDFVINIGLFNDIISFYSLNRLQEYLNQMLKNVGYLVIHLKEKIIRIKLGLKNE